MSSPDTPVPHEPCPKCGEQHNPRKCPSHSKQTGKQCGQPLGAGTDHLGHGLCEFHGGKSPGGRKQAERLRVEVEIAETLERYELAPGADDPLEQLLSALRTAGAMRRIFAELVGTLGGGATRMYVERDDEDGSVMLTAAQPMGVVGPDHKGDGKPHVYVDQLRVWTVEAARVAKLALDANIDERQVRVAERYAEGLGRVVQGVAAAIIGAFISEGTAQDVVKRVQSDLGPLIRGVIEESGVIETTATEETE